jgi:hypothetical protein
VFKRLFLTIFFISFAVSFVYAEDARVVISGVEVDFADQEPVIIDGRTLIPVREVFETLGFEVEWNPLLSEVTLTNEEHTVVIAEFVPESGDRPVFYVNGEKRLLEVPAQRINGRTMIPIRG